MTTLVQFADYYVSLFDSLKTTLNIDNVFFGDQTQIPGPRTVCVETNEKQNELTRAASARAVKKTFTIYIFVYCNRLADQHENRKESDILAEAVEDEISKRPRCGGLVNHTMVTLLESGYVTKPTNDVIAANRLTVTGIVEEFLPESVE